MYLSTRKPLLAASLAIVVVAMFACESEAGVIGDYIGGAKRFLVEKAKEGVLSRSAVLTSFSETLENIKTRYNEAKSNGELEGKSETEASELYYRIVIEEVKKLREHIETDKSGEIAKELIDETKLDVESIKPQDSFVSACANCQAGLEMEMELDEEEELELLSKLDELDNSEEKEMGWALSDESKQLLKMRTQKVLMDLLTNEVRQLAMSLISSYFMEGPAGAISIALQAAIKYKLAQYFLNCIMDVLASVTGYRIDIPPAIMNFIAPAPAPAPAVAAA